MDENNPTWKKPWRRLKQSHSDPHLAEERGGRATSYDPSSLSSSRNGSRGRLMGSMRKIFGKVTKRLARSARQSPNPEPTAASSSLQDTQPVQSTKDLTLPTLEPNCEQSSNSGIIEISSTNEVRNSLIRLDEVLTSTMLRPNIPTRRM
ncbi:uncharacterized protein EDB93DRAFT_1339666 [Suillus bovinus]|uniref:uncharacterized protein n=1 Tax=Suillus bovinus TaxID=48563 RepID=UPI001B87F3DE|nr:uncharacterized protein EDB93DRAFT_1339666 [Suillus bovinus]KAG2135202.1 hypothetical protein EDB93DRAFT_1339666 [Suillus bovinus]